jgi:hypothetical protein
VRTEIEKIAFVDLCDWSLHKISVGRYEAAGVLAVDGPADNGLVEGAI